MEITPYDSNILRVLQKTRVTASAVLPYKASLTGAMNFYSFVYGPLLWIAFLTFGLGLLTRITLVILINANRYLLIAKGFSFKNMAGTLVRLLSPLHNTIIKRPVYTLLRYVFHGCVITVPIFLVGHISLWEESRFELSWAPIPDSWAEVMTLIVIGTCILFLARRAILPTIRRSTSLGDYLLIFLTGLPFLTGYCYVRDIPESIPLISRNMEMLHVLSGEILLIMVAILFCESRFNREKCIICGSCELSCPENAIKLIDEGESRVVEYSFYQCVCCASCATICPEGAVELRHKISVKMFGRITYGERARARLELCRMCGTPFVPVPQIEKIREMIDHESVLVCLKCKKMHSASVLNYPGGLEKALNKY